MIESPAAPAAPDSRDRLVSAIPGGTWPGWAGPLLVTLFGAFLRFDRLSVPHGVVFDETYYVPDAYGILKHGVEISHVRNSDALLAHGGTHILLGTAGRIRGPSASRQDHDRGRGVAVRPYAVRLAIRGGASRFCWPS